MLRPVEPDSTFDTLLRSRTVRVLAPKRLDDFDAERPPLEVSDHPSVRTPSVPRRAACRVSSFRRNRVGLRRSRFGPACVPWRHGAHFLAHLGIGLGREFPECSCQVALCPGTNGTANQGRAAQTEQIPDDQQTIGQCISHTVAVNIECRLLGVARIKRANSPSASNQAHVAVVGLKRSSCNNKLARRQLERRAKRRPSVREMARLRGTARYPVGSAGVPRAARGRRRWRQLPFGDDIRAFRPLLAEQLAKDKATGYMSVPRSRLPMAEKVAAGCCGSGSCLATSNRIAA